jgi:hypothetical protein
MESIKEPSMRPKYRSLAVSLGIVAVAAVSAFLWPSHAGAHPTTPSLGVPLVSWQDRIEGQPFSFRAGAASGVYFWHNEPAGLSLRTTNPPRQAHEYSGLISTDGTIFNITPVDLEPDDSYSLDPAGQNLSFDFHTDSAIDGLDFEIAGGTGLKLGAQWDGDALPLRRIFLGADGVHPENNPLWVCRDEGGACLANLP